MSLLTLSVTKFCDEGVESSLGSLTNSIRSFLPGFSTTFFRIITTDDKRSSRIREVFKLLFITYELIQAAFNAWSSILTSVFQEGTHGQERNYINKPELVTTSEWIKTTVLHLNALVSKTIDSIIHVHLELDVNKNIRLSTAFAHWLGVLLLKCHRLINLEDSQHLRYTVVSGLLTLASQSSSSVSVTNENSKQDGSFLAQKILSEYTTLSNVNTNSIMDRKSLSNLFGHKLIRKVAFDSLTEQTNCLMNQLFSLLGRSIRNFSVRAKNVIL
ncbi:unnamed protein product [Trichobilharzia regenti]|nr:unnamed protein product [Trichobilharzia regenti]